MEGQPEIVRQALDYAQQGWEIARSWLLSPAAWSQFGLLLIAFLVGFPQGLFGERVDLVRLVAVGLVLAGVALLEWRPGDGTPEASVAPGSHTGVVEPVAELGSSGDAELGVHPLQVRVDRPS